MPGKFSAFFPCSVIAAVSISSAVTSVHACSSVEEGRPACRPGGGAIRSAWDARTGARRASASKERPGRCFMQEKVGDEQGWTKEKKRLRLVFFSVADHPIHRRAFPADVMAGLLAFVPLVEQDFLFDIFPLTKQTGVFDPLIHRILTLACGRFVIHSSGHKNNQVDVILNVGTFPVKRSL